MNETKFKKRNLVPAQIVLTSLVAVSASAAWHPSSYASYGPYVGTSSDGGQTGAAYDNLNVPLNHKKQLMALKRSDGLWYAAVDGFENSDFVWVNEPAWVETTYSVAFALVEKVADSSKYGWGHIDSY